MKLFFSRIIFVKIGSTGLIWSILHISSSTFHLRKRVIFAISVDCFWKPFFASSSIWAPILNFAWHILIVLKNLGFVAEILPKFIIEICYKFTQSRLQIRRGRRLCHFVDSDFFREQVIFTYLCNSLSYVAKITHHCVVHQALKEFCWYVYRFDAIQTCDGQTDGRTDGETKLLQ